MKALAPLFALIASEVRSRRRILLLGLGLGLVPLILPAIFADLNEEGSVIAILVTAIASVPIAPAIGVSVLSGDLASRRFGFYLSRPIGVATIIAGKVLAGLLVLGAMQVLMVLPGLFWGLAPLGRVITRTTLGGGPGLTATVLTFAVMNLLLFTVGLVGGLLVRLRSRALVADAAALVAFVLVTLVAVHRWTFHINVWNNIKNAPLGSAFVQMAQGSAVALAWLGLVAWLWLTAVWLVAVTLAVARGRADGARVHRSITFVAWPATLASVALFVFAPDLVARRTPDDPMGPITAAGADGWVAFGGEFAPIFVQPQSGRTRFTPWALRGRIPFDAYGVTIARAAPRAVWLSGQAGWIGQLTRAGEIVILDLDQPDAPPRHVPLGDHTLGPISVAPDGRRWVMIESPPLGTPRGRLWAVDLDTGATIMDTWVPADRMAELAFVSPTVLRFYRRQTDGDGSSYEIYEADLIATTVRRSGTIGDGAVLARGYVRTNDNAAEVLVTQADRAIVADGRTGAVRAQYALGFAEARGFRLFDDGSIAMAEWRDGRLFVRHGQGGSWAVPIDLGATVAVKELRISALQPRAAEILVHAVPTCATCSTWSTTRSPWRVGVKPGSPLPQSRSLLVDLTTRTVTEMPDTVRVTGVHPGWQSRPAPGHPASRLVLSDDGGQVFFFDPVTGGRTHVAGRPPAAPVLVAR